jgi:hypothetical protein
VVEGFQGEFAWRRILGHELYSPRNDDMSLQVHLEASYRLAARAQPPSISDPNFEAFPIRDHHRHALRNLVTTFNKVALFPHAR